MRGDSHWAGTPNVILEPLEHSRKWYIGFDWEIVIVCAPVVGKKKLVLYRPLNCIFYFYLRAIISQSDKSNHYLALYPLTLKWQTQNTICYTLLVLDSVIYVRGGIGRTGQIVTPWQMRSVYLWNCSQSCKTDLLNTDELEPIQCDTLKITVGQT